MKNISLATVDFAYGAGCAWCEVSSKYHHAEFSCSIGNGCSEDEAYDKAYAQAKAYMKDLYLADEQIYVLANMMNNGKPFSVVRKRDEQGGFYVEIEDVNYKCNEIESIVWVGTPIKFAWENRSFLESSQVYNNTPKATFISAIELLKAHL